MQTKIKSKHSLCRMFLSLGLLCCLVMTGYFGTPVRAEETETVATLDTQTVIGGEEEPGSKVSIMVYAVRGGFERVVLFSTNLEVGSSGLYQVSVPLPIMGEQYVAVIVGNNMRLTKYIRYSKTLGDTLSGTYLNVYEYLLEDEK